MADQQGGQLIRLRFYDPDGTELDVVTIYQDGNSANIPARAAWVEVTTATEATS